MQNRIKELLKNQKKVVLFDGVCNFCNSSILKIIRHDKDNVFFFASIQSDIGLEIITHFNIDVLKVDSIILVESEQKFSIKSSAALRILKEFNGFWKILQIGWIFPENFRNNFYDYIAKNRYRWFGKKDECMIPTPKIKSKFI